MGHANVGMRVDVLLAPSKGAVGRGEDRVSAGHLLGDAPLFFFLAASHATFRRKGEERPADAGAAAEILPQTANHEKTVRKGTEK